MGTTFNNGRNIFNKLPFLVIFTCILFHYQFVFAEEEKQYKQLLQEVIRSELVYPQDKGEIQISLVPSYFKQRSTKTAIAPLFIELGLTDSWQLNLFMNPYINNQPNGEAARSGFGDVGIGTKYSFMNINNSNYHAAFTFDVLFPTGNVNKELSEGSQVYEPSLEFAKDFPLFYQSQLFSQVGFEFVRQIYTPNNKSETEEAEPVIPDEIEGNAHTFFFNIGYFLPIGKARYVLEMNWENDRWNHKGKNNILYLTPGVVWELPHRFEMAMGASAGLTDTSDPYDLFFRLTYEFDTLPFKKTLS